MNTDKRCRIWAGVVRGQLNSLFLLAHAYFSSSGNAGGAANVVSRLISVARAILTLALGLRGQPQLLRGEIHGLELSQAGNAELPALVVLFRRYRDGVIPNWIGLRQLQSGHEWVNPVGACGVTFSAASGSKESADGLGDHYCADENRSLEEYMRVVLVGALLALPAVAKVPSYNPPNVGVAQVSSEKPGSDEKSHSVLCHEKPRTVLLETGIHIDLIYCGIAPDITTTSAYQAPNADGKFYTITTHNIHRDRDGSRTQIRIYKPNADWAVPLNSLDIMGAAVLKDGDVLENGGADDSWVAQQDLPFNHQGQDWLRARQIVMQKRATRQWVYYRIIVDTRHNLLYVLYQKDDDGGANQENSFFNSFTVDPNSFSADPGKAPGAHLPPPYPNP